MLPHENCFIQTALGHKGPRTPVWLMRQAGRYLPEYLKLRQQGPNFIDFCHNPQLCCEATMQPIRRYDLDAAIVFNDILTLPDTMGAAVRFESGVGPIFDHPMANQNDLALLKEINASDMDYVQEAICRLKTTLPKNMPLIGFAGSPWTVACYMVEGHGSKVWPKTRQMLYQNPELLHQLLAQMTRNTLTYVNSQIDAGADAIMLFDSWGSLLAHDCYQAFSLNYIQTIFQAIQQRDLPHRIPLLLFSKHATPSLKVISECGCDVVALDSSVDLADAIKRIPTKTLQGNLDPFCLYAPKKQLHSTTYAMLEACKKTPYIANLGHGVDKLTPPEGVANFIAAVRQWDSHHAS